MKIGDLAARTGVAPRLLRYYEEVGLLHPFRNANGYRGYGEPAVDRVLQIRELLETGLTTEMIRELLPCIEATKEELADRVCPAPADPDGLRRQLSSIERRIDVLQRNRQAIQAYLRACGEAEAATPEAVVGALDSLRRDGPDARSDVDARRRERGSSGRERQVQ
ncbi:MerR family transcriptional regulator [Streptomyces sp. NPDC096934]|uniref:MerR family transcriptional regulator n=1 Tax=Streptomyces sp. NPDC096934 TaxID=3155551 RepID=UPI00332CECCB